MKITISFENPITKRWIVMLCLGILVGMLSAGIQRIIQSGNFHMPFSELLHPTSVYAQDNTSLYSRLLRGTTISPELQTATISASLDSSIAGASAYILVNQDTHEILASKNLHTPLQIASLTKVMSAIVASDITVPSEKFTASQTAATITPTRIGVLPGEEFQVSELLPAMLLSSGNDAAEVMTEGIDNLYSKGTFIRAMNTKAGLLHLNNTHFSNSQGFDDKENYSSVYDLAKLSNTFFSSYPTLSRIVEQDHMILDKNESHHQFYLENWNGLLGVYPDTVGLKIGNTPAAGKTIIVLSHREGKNLLAIVLGAPGEYERDLWAASLLNFGYSLFGKPPALVTANALMNKYSQWNLLRKLQG